MTRTSISPSSALAAVRADCTVADRPPERLMQTTESAPASAGGSELLLEAPG